MRFHFFSIHTPSRTSLFPYTTLFRSEKAGEVGAAIELNADPHRLDLDWRLCRAAKEHGVLVEIGPDAHSAQGLDNVRSEEHTFELQSPCNLVCRLLLEKKK